MEISVCILAQVKHVVPLPRDIFKYSQDYCQISGAWWAQWSAALVVPVVGTSGTAGEQWQRSGKCRYPPNREQFVAVIMAQVGYTRPFEMSADDLHTGSSDSC